MEMAARRLLLAAPLGEPLEDETKDLKRPNGFYTKILPPRPLWAFAVVKNSKQKSPQRGLDVYEDFKKLIRLLLECDDASDGSWQRQRQRQESEGGWERGLQGLGCSTG